jgi:hypothetical protein
VGSLLVVGPWNSLAPTGDFDQLAKVQVELLDCGCRTLMLAVLAAGALDLATVADWRVTGAQQVQIASPGLGSEG